MTAVQLVLGGFAPPLDPGLSQWHCPVGLANRIAQWAGVKPGDRVLEPCAGGGNLARPCVAAGAKVTAVEIDPAWADVLRNDPTLDGTVVHTADFMTLRPEDLGTCDLAVMNSPFEGGADAIWLERVLEFVPRVVAVGPSRILFGQEKHERVWSKHSLIGLANMIRRPVFFGSGGKFDVVVVDVERGLGKSLRRLEWWP